MNDATMPTARSKGLVISEIGDDLVIYDQTSHTMHQLDRTSASVWHACDGRTTIASIGLSQGLTREMVAIGVAKLEDAGLLTEPWRHDAPAPSRSRRGLLKRAAIAGSVPVVLSISAPMAAWANSDPPMIEQICDRETEADCWQGLHACCIPYCSEEGKSLFSATPISCTPKDNGAWEAIVGCRCEEGEVH